MALNQSCMHDGIHSPGNDLCIVDWANITNQIVMGNTQFGQLYEVSATNSTVLNHSDQIFAVCLCITMIVTDRWIGYTLF